MAGSAATHAPSNSNRGRIILVTGGCGGIGAAVTRRIASEGGKVAIADLDAGAGAVLVEEVGSDKAHFVHCDVRDENSIARAIDAAAEHFGALHGAVLAAGIVNRSHKTPLSDITAEEFDDTCAINLRGSFLCLKHAARHGCCDVMVVSKIADRTIKQCGHGSGSIVTIASIAGLRGSALIDPCYSVSKFGVIGLSQTAAAKLCADKIRVNCVAPTAVATPMTASFSRPDEPEAARAKRRMWMQTMLPMHQTMVSASAMAGIICFLLSPAATDVNGTTLPVDQGYAAGATAASHL